MILEAKTIGIKGKEARFYELSKGGVPACFYPANGFPVGTYSTFLKRLTAKHELSCIELRACWPNIGKPAQQTNWELYADDLIDFIEKNYNKPVVGIGHSQGATASIIAASKRPELFESLITIEPAFVDDGIAKLLQLVPYAIKKYTQPLKSGLNKQDVWESKEAFYEDCRKNRAYKRISNEVLTDFANYGLKSNGKGQFTLIFPAAWEASNYALAPSIWKYLRKIEIPIQVIAGKPSVFFNHKLRAKWMHVSANSTMEINSNFGHLFPLESPKTCAETIL